LPEDKKYLLIQILAVGLVLCGLWEILVAWCLVSMAVCGTSYAYFGVKLINKSPEGEFNFLSQLVNAPWRWEYYAVVVLDRFRNPSGVNEIIPGLWLGRYPMGNDIPQGVKLVVDLTTVLPRPKGIGAGVDYLCLPTLDGYAPERESFLELVDKVAKHPGPVLIHCARGRGRSATAMAADLIKRGLAADVDEAFALMKQRRSSVRLHRQQLESLHGIHLERVA